MRLILNFSCVQACGLKLYFQTDCRQSCWSNGFHIVPFQLFIYVIQIEAGVLRGSANIGALLLCLVVSGHRDSMLNRFPATGADITAERDRVIWSTKRGLMSARWWPSLHGMEQA